MEINENTKISTIIKHNPEAIEKIVSISKHFEKLRIPVLRKVLASRVSIKQAAKIGGVTVQDFFEKLSSIGFVCSNLNKVDNLSNTNNYKNDFIHENIVEFDVRKMLQNNIDPFNKIMKLINNFPDKSTLKIINTFEPTPLITILEKKGFSYKVEHINNNLVNTYFNKHNKIDEFNLNNKDKESIVVLNKTISCKELLNIYAGKVKEIDVRNLEMPQPMLNILTELKSLPNNYMLLVHHKKIPQFLFPELVENNFKWLLEEIEDGYVKLYIFK
jgi:TusA-related sulfurtransferase/uncharacterized protein (DUF2249 family)